jgi:hypothetical protein
VSDLDEFTGTVGAIPYGKTGRTGKVGVFVFFKNNSAVTGKTRGIGTKCPLYPHVDVVIMASLLEHLEKCVEFTEIY